MSLTINHSQQGAAEVIRAEGRVDSSNAGEFEAAAMQAVLVIFLVRPFAAEVFDVSRDQRRQIVEVGVEIV